MSPRTKEQNEAIREARIHQIRIAAAEVYLLRGMSFEMRDVAAHAGLGYGTVYHYYRNKHELFGELLERALDAAAEMSARTLSGDRPLPERLRTWAASLLKLWAEEPIVYILYKMAAENFHQLPPEAGGRLPKRFAAELYGPVVEALQGAGDTAAGGGPGDRGGHGGSTAAEETADVLIGSLIGCAGLWLHRGRKEWDAEGIAERMLKAAGLWNTI